MSFPSLFSTLRVSPISSSISRSFSTSLSARALEASIYVSQLTKSDTAADLQNLVKSSGLEVVGSRLLASKGSKAKAGLVQVLGEDEINLSDVVKAVRSLNVKSNGEKGVFSIYLPADSPAAGLARPSTETVEILNLPDSIKTKDAVRTLIYYTAYSEASKVRMINGPEDEEGNAIDPEFASGIASATPSEERFRERLLMFSGQVVDQNEIIVLPAFNIVKDQYRIFSSSPREAAEEEPVEEEELAEEEEVEQKASR